MRKTIFFLFGLIFLNFASEINAQLGTPCEFSTDCANPIEQTCNNNFVCACRSGFTEASGICVDVNECTLPTPPCSPQAECTNSEGSFSCACASGFVGDGVICLGRLPVVRVTGVRSTSFQVNYTDVENANYIIRIYREDDSLINETRTTLTNVTFNLPDPITNVYMIEVAYIVSGIQSDYSERISSRIWNITNVTSTSITMNWVMFDPVSFYEYDVINEQGFNVDNGNEPNTSHTFLNLQPAMRYTIQLLASRLLPAMGNITDFITMVPLLKIDQFTTTSRPNPRIVSQTNVTLIIEWDSVAGAGGYFARLLPGGRAVAGVNGLGIINGLRATLTGLPPGMRFTFELCSISQAGNSCALLPINGPLILPPAPDVVEIGADSIELQVPTLLNVINYQFIATDANRNRFPSTESSNRRNVINLLRPLTRYSILARITYEVGSVNGPATSVITAQSVLDLRASPSGTSVTLSFVSFENLEFFTIAVTDLNANVQLAVYNKSSQDAMFVGSRTRETISGLSSSTSYMFFVSVYYRNQTGFLLRAVGSINVTTSNLTTVSRVRVLGVQPSGFIILVDEIQNALTYTARTYFEGSLVDERESQSSRIPITGFNPVANEYFVSVAYNTPAPSDFSPIITTKIWNFTDIDASGVTLCWLPFSDSARYRYNVTDPRGNTVIADNTNATKNRFTYLLPGVVHTFEVLVSVTSIYNKELYFIVTQLTAPAAPTPFVVSQNSSQLVVSWNNVTGTERYEVCFTFENGTDAPGVNLNFDARNLITINNLMSGVSYTFKVCAINSAGRQCGVITIIGQAVAPGFPIVVSVTQTTISVRIDPIADVVNYFFRIYSASGTLRETSTVSLTPATTFDRLTAGTRYLIRAYASYQSLTASGGLISQVTASANPSNLMLQSTTSTTASVIWTNDNSVIESLITMERTNDDKMVFQDRSVIGEFYQLNDLQPGTSYTLCVRNRNAANDSGSTCLTFQTAPAAPTGLEFILVTQTEITVTFNEAVGAEGYRLTRNPDGTFRSTLDTTFPFDNLSPATFYSITVQAFSPASANPLGTLFGPVSDPIIVRTAPFDVGNLRVTARTSRSLTISYDEAIGADRYLVSWTPASVNSIETLTVLNNTVATITNLLPGTVYDITVVAVNSFGLSMATGRLTNECTRSVSPPILEFSSFSPTYFIVSWSTQRGAVSYSARVVLTADGSIPTGVSFNMNPNMLHIQVTGLMPGTEYSVSITTNDKFGPVSESTVATEITVPGRTSRLEITSQRLDSIEFEWSEVQGADRYRVIVREVETSLLVRNQDVERLTDIASSLSSGTEYIISVSAANRNGVGIPFTTRAFTVFSSSDATVTFISNTETTITVNHTSGISGVVSYRVIATINDVVISSCPSSGSRCTLPGLSPGIKYNVSVVGIYQSGSESPPSDPVLLTTVPGRPANPTILREDFRLLISFDLVDGATFYTARLNENVLTNNLPQFIFKHLRSGENYVFDISATKTTSYGQFTSQTLNIQESTTRAIPTNVNVVNVQSTQFDVYWIEIPGALRYVVTATPVNPFWNQQLSQEQNNQQTIDNLEPGELYDVTVRGVYSTGAGPESDPVRQQTAPSSPINLRIVNVGSSSIEITWDLARSANGYRVYYSPETTSLAMVIPTSSNTLPITGLQPATIYQLQVSAMSGDLESARSPVLQQITAPLNPMFLTTGETQTTIMAAWSVEPGTASFCVTVLLNGVTIIDTRTPDSSVSFSYMDGIRPGQNYSICVQGKTDTTPTVGIPQSSEIVCRIITTDPGNTTSLVEISTTSSSLTVRWSPAPGATYYWITAVLQSDPSSPPRTQIVRGDNVGTINGLTADTNYIVSVTPFNHLDEASFTFGNLVVTTNPETPIVYSVNATDSTLLVGWRSDPRVVFLSIVRVRSIDGCTQEIVVQENGNIFIRSGFMALVSNLCPASEYNVSVVVFTRLKRSEPGFQILLTTPASPQNIRVTSANADTLVFEWDPSTGATRYEVIPFANGNPVANLSSISPTRLVSNLQQSLLYFFQFFAINSAGRSPPATFTTTTATVPQRPVVLSFNATSEMIRIVFRRPIFGTTINVRGEPTMGPLIEANGLSGTNVTFTDIILGVPYNFTLVTVNTFGDQSLPNVIIISAPLKLFWVRIFLSPAIQYLRDYDVISSIEYNNTLEQIIQNLNSALSTSQGFQNLKVEEIYQSLNDFVVELRVYGNRPMTTFSTLNETYQSQRNDAFLSPVFTTPYIPLPPTVLNGTVSNGNIRFTIARLPAGTTVTLQARNVLGELYTVENVPGPTVGLERITLGTSYNFTMFTVNDNGVRSLVGVSGSVTAPPATFSFEVNFSPNFVLDPAVLNPSSPQYNSFINSLTSLLQNALNCNLNQCIVSVVEVSPSDSRVRFQVAATDSLMSTETLSGSFVENNDPDIFDPSIRLVGLNSFDINDPVPHMLPADTSSSISTTTTFRPIIQNTPVEPESSEPKSSEPDSGTIVGITIACIISMIIIVVITIKVVKARKEYNDLLQC